MNEAAYHAILRRLGVEPVTAESNGSDRQPMPPPAPMDTEELTRRVTVFRRQVEVWTNSELTGVPLLALPEAPEPRLGQCISCGEAISEDRWRCALCLEAVHQALGMEPPEGDG